MLPRRTVIAADRSRLGAAKPSDRAQWKTSLAVAVIWIATAAGGIRAVAAAGRVLVFATNRVGWAAAVATWHQVIWTASGSAASVSAAPEGAKTQRPRCRKADENPCHPPHHWLPWRPRFRRIAHPSLACPCTGPMIDSERRDEAWRRTKSYERGRGLVHRKKFTKHGLLLSSVPHARFAPRLICHHRPGSTPMSSPITSISAATTTDRRLVRIRISSSGRVGIYSSTRRNSPASSSPRSRRWVGSPRSS
jgi:hypothetical protein